MVSFMFFKTLHLIEYGILFLLTERALKLSLPRLGKKVRLGRMTWSWRPAWLALIFVLLYGASDEFHQTLVPTREGHLRDVLIDGLGGWLAWHLPLRKN